MIIRAEAYPKTKIVYTDISNKLTIKMRIMYKFFSLILAIITIVPLQVFAMPDVKEALSNVEFTGINDENTKINAYEGKIILLFFGYTHCPDICPTTLLDISRSLKELGKDADKVQAVFVSVDYKRDTLEHLETYVKFFDNRILGLTSDKKNLDQITQDFKTQYALLDATSENYLVEHSSNLYVLDQDLQVRRIIPNGLPSSEITKAIKKLLP